MNQINIRERSMANKDPIKFWDTPGVENPLELKSIKIVRLTLMTIGCWPDEQFGKKVPLFVTFLKRTLGSQVFVVLIGTAYYMYVNVHNIDFFAVGHILITTFLCTLMTVRVSLPQFKEYGLIVKDFTDFHLIHFKDTGEHYKEVYEFWNKASTYFTYYQLVITIITIMLYTAMPLSENYAQGAFQRPHPKNRTYDYSVYYKYPGFDQNDHFYPVVLFNIYCTYNCTLSITCMDLLLSLIVFQIIGHIKTLMMDMEKMPRPRSLRDVTHEFPTVAGQARAYVEKFDGKENRIVREELNKMICHHRRIVRFAKRVSTFFGPMLALNYLIHLVSGCILLLECSSGNTKNLIQFGPLTAAIFGQLVQISSVFEFVGYMSEKLIDSAYLLPWECMDIRNQRTVLFLLNRIQTPIQLTALGLVPVGVKTMQAILKSTLSFFMFLQTLSE